MRLLITSTGFESAKLAIGMLEISDMKRRQIYRALARKVSTYARKHIRDQVSPNGSAFKPRKPPAPGFSKSDGQRGKMLKKMARGKNMKEATTPDYGKVYWPVPWVGVIANRHQEGMIADAKAIRREERARSRKGRARGGADGWGKDPATTEQALRLIALGFKVRRKGKGKFSPSKKWIKENLTINHAGLIIRWLKDHQPDTTKETITLPSRPFLGVSPAENAELRKVVSDLIIRYAA